MAIQRNVLVPPFSVKTPLLEEPGTTRGKQVRSGVSRPQIKWLQSVEQAVNNSAQIATSIPAHNNSPGQPGDFIWDANYLYVAVGVNQWGRILLDRTF